MKPGIPTFLFSLLLLAGLPCTSAAQNLTGIWRGYFNTYSGDDYKFEIQIEQTKSNRISGVSYSYLDTRFYGKAALTGSFNKAGKAALIQEIKTVEVKMAGGSFACIMKCSFVYTKSGNEEFLDGTYTSTFEKSDPVMGIKRGEDCGGGTVHLRRVVTSDFYVEPFLRKKEEPKKTAPVIKKSPVKTPPKPDKKPANTTPQKNSKPVVTVPKTDSVRKKGELVVIENPVKQVPKISIPAVTRSRENELVKTYTVHEDEITIRLYDNGEIDNDTISVYLDGKPLVTNQRLTTNPITLTIKMSEDNPEHTLVMVAENLGRIPPNTSLMIVQDGDNRYTASITSTEQKNAMVRFRYQKKDNDHLYNILFVHTENNYFSFVNLRLIISSLLVIISGSGFSQELNGIWKGTLTQQPGGCFPVYNVELQVKITNNKVDGFCYHYSDILNYVKKDYDGFYNAATKTINIQERKVMTFHIPQECTPCIRYFTLSYSRSGKEETLSGDWGGVVMNGTASCTPGKIVLHRIIESEFNHIQEIKVDTGVLRLDFYDNAQIDGDSISVTVNNRTVVSNQVLSVRPISIDVKVDLDNPEQEVTMIGENLGTIPPNTALLIVTARNKRYQLFLTSTGRKNAQVRFIYEKASEEK